ncbi:lamin tail domain-containing protein [Parvicella tangerina]|uniref:T9SS C-terminal target domain-containing protein n=1 Tax=Parvicella tangerina TaxID=2829795 RepID=A0A916JM57_9FLAO|nr:lamin tail domain-containing protein [Parvicella tangerina]CAG5081381.1 hypothetical protein CRYO30217_01614 [Parvicella tangerina]
MKKHLLILFTLFSACFIAQQGQILETNQSIPFPQKELGSNYFTKAITACSEDTVRISYAKATGLSTLSLNSASSAQRVGQYFNANQDLTISGAQFYAYKSDLTGGASISVDLEIYLAGADSLPTGAPIASTSVVVDTSFGGGSLDTLKKQAVFTTPVTVNQPYLVVLSNLSPNSIVFVSNSYISGDGNQEWYSSLDLFGTWLRSYDVNVGGTPFDADALIEPFVSYDLQADFTATPATWSSASTPVNFTNTSSAVIMDRMYSYAEFLAMNELSFTWDYGNGNPVENVVDGATTYPNVQNYAVTLTDTLYGWTRNCITDTVKMIGATPNLVISEIMYNPPESGTDSLEFIEIYNAGATSVDLTDFYFDQGVVFTFPSVTLAASDYIVVCIDSLAIDNNFGVAAYEWTAGALSNGGEDIVLKDNFGVTIDSVDYKNTSTWSTAANGGGPSLVLCDVFSDNNDGANWSASATGTGIIINGNELMGSPGSVNACCVTAYDTDIISACNSYTWIDGNTYTASNNTATHTIVGATPFGCDSIITLDLTINTPTSGTDVLTSCGPYTWIDGNTYSASNNTATYIIVGGAANGCDSLVTLDLTVLAPATGTDTQSACGSFTWIDGNTYTANNSTATHNIVGGAANGCDSLVTLDLTILQVATGTDTQSACDSFTWIDGNTYTASNNTATHTIVGGAANGCDSIVTLDLTINTVDVSITNSDPTLTANATGATYQWLDCDNGNSPISGETGQSFTATANGNYAVEVTQNGCADQSTCETIISLSLNEFTLGNVSVYPNPNAGEFQLIGVPATEEVVVTVTDNLGKVIGKYNINQVNSTVTIEGAAGVYFVIVESSNASKTFKVLKH